MNRITLTLNFFILFLITNAQVPSFQWAKNIGGSALDGARTVATDNRGNVFAAGVCKGIIDFDPGPSTYTAGSLSGKEFITKFDAFGNFLWVRTIGDSLQYMTLSITTNTLGDLYLTGEFTDTLDFDPGVGTFTLSPVGQSDIFILKLDANGNFVWAKSFKGIGYDRGLEIKTDNSGNIYTSGYYSDTVDFDPGIATYTLGSNGGGDIFVSKLDASGNFVWAKSLGGSGVQDFGYLAVDNNGAVFVTGRFFGTCDFDPGIGIYNLTPVGSGDIFICKLDQSGNFVWAKNIGGSSADEAFSIAVDNAGGLYVTGHYMSANVDFDPGPGTFIMSSTGGGLDIFIVKLNTSGNFIWAKTFTGNGAETAYSIAYDGFNGIYTTGNFSSLTDFDPGPATFNLSIVGFYDIFISKLDTAGNFIWAGGMGSTFAESSNDIATDAYGNVFTVGGFKSVIDCDFSAATSTLSSNGDYDVFIHKLNNCLTPSIINTTPASSQTFCVNNSATLTASSTGIITWFALVSSVITPVATGPSYVIPTLASGTYTYYMQAQNCSATSSLVPVIISVQLCTGLNEFKNKETNIKVYPNPVKDLLTVDMLFSGKKEILIYNVNGSLMQKIYTTENNYLFSLSEYVAGFYLLKINSDSGSFNYKLIKE
ncbi:MAG: T9SS type A sorting domain-containing protein [Bacteroidetes bacterium]|nr:T9SS type A sorting domain-containing protein [Bacteroidota bacterium]